MNLSAMTELLPHGWEQHGEKIEGPCPFCGGETTADHKSDRFVVFLNNGDDARFACRRCGKKGSIIDLYREIKGGGFLDACRALQIDREALNRGSRSYGGRGQSGGEPSPSPRQTQDKCRVVDHEKWQKAAYAFYCECMRETWSSIASTEYLQLAQKSLKDGRGIDVGNELYGVAYCPHLRSVSRSEWGLPETGKKLVIPRGIAIFNWRNENIIEINIRREDSDIAEYEKKTGVKLGKYQEVGYEYIAPHIVGESGLPLFIVESALDAVLIVAKSKCTVSAMALQGTHKMVIDDIANEFIKNATPLILTPDNDDAGVDAYEQWKNLFTDGILEPFPQEYKDAGDLFRAKKRGKHCPALESWIREAVEDAKKTMTEQNARKCA